MPKAKWPLMIGFTYDHLLVLRRVPRSETTKRNVVLECACRCGKRLNVMAGDLVSGRRVSCGCKRSSKPELKVCPCCKEVKPFTEDFFGFDAHGTHSLKNECKLCTQRRTKEYVRRLRQEALTAYSEGGVVRCRCCGERQVAFLTLDHPNDDGHLDRKQHGSQHQLLLFLKRRGWPKGYFHIMCYNCNLGRAQTPDGICPHKRQS